MKRYISWSGGKDSSASIVLCHEKGVRLDGVVMSEVMFDHSRNISGENPEHIKWVYEVAKPIIEKMGYPVIILRDKEDYISLFNHRINNSKIESRNGKKRGWLIGGRCAANSRLKMRPLRDFFKNIGECERVVGIALDEPKRLERINAKNNTWSILEREGVVESETYDICRKHNLLSPTYQRRSRGGCWFCPNCGIKEFATFAKEHPELWGELEKLSHSKDLVSQGFKYGRTFGSIDRQVKEINGQLSFFE